LLCNAPSAPFFVFFQAFLKALVAKAGLKSVIIFVVNVGATALSTFSHLVRSLSADCDVWG
jgi:hypothetical protein